MLEIILPFVRFIYYESTWFVIKNCFVAIEIGFRVNFLFDIFSEIFLDNACNMVRTSIVFRKPWV